MHCIDKCIITDMFQCAVLGPLVKTVQTFATVSQDHVTEQVGSVPGTADLAGREITVELVRGYRYFSFTIYTKLWQ